MQALKKLDDLNLKEGNLPDVDRLDNRPKYLLL